MAEDNWRKALGKKILGQSSEGNWVISPQRAFLTSPFLRQHGPDVAWTSAVHCHTNCHTQHSNDSIKPSDMSQFLVYTKCCQLCQNDNSYFNWTSYICHIVAFQGWRNHQILSVDKVLLWVNFYSAIVCFPGTLIELQWTWSSTILVFAEACEGCHWCFASFFFFPTTNPQCCNHTTLTANSTSPQ